jgi:apolipoprotein N-acyltransferase
LAALVPAVAFTLVVLLARYAMLVLPAWLAVFAFPCAITSYEFLASSNAYTGTLFSMAYSQVDVLPLLQITSLFGIASVTFLVSLLPSALATPWHGKPMQILVAPAALLVVAFVFGMVRLQGAVPAQTVRVGLAGSDAAYKLSTTQTRDTAISVIDAYSKAIAELSAQGAQVVVLPEKILGYVRGDKTELLSKLGELARTAKVTLIVGASENDTPRRNIAWVVDAEGKLVAEYAKHHLVPGIESGYAPGSSPSVFDVNGVRVGLAICKDNDFPPWLRRFGREDMKLLLVPALDFDVDERLHARIALVRAVENGAALARVAGRGRLTLSDAHGRIVVEKSTHDAPMVTVLGELRVGTGTTFYSRHGDVWALLCLMGTVAMLAASIAMSIRRRKSPT